MASQSEVRITSSSLVDRKGFWTVVGRYNNPTTGKISYLSKSTRFSVKQHTKRKAEAMVDTIVDGWNAELAAKFNSNPDEPEQQEVTEQPKQKQVVVHGPKFSEYVEVYLAAKEAEGVAETSLRTYSLLARNTLTKYFGDMYIEDIKRDTIQSFVIDQKKSVSINTIKVRLVILKCILDLAVEDDIIRKNPAKKFKIGDGEGARKNGVYTIEQLKSLLKFMDAYGEPYLSITILGGIYGLRRGEISGLRWSDIDFESKTMTIQHTVTQVNGDIIELDRTKTKSSIRTLYLIDATIPYFKALKQTHIDCGYELSYVVRSNNGTIIQPSTISIVMPRLMRRAGLPAIRLHDLRATALTLLSKVDGVTVKEVADFAGHANPSVTLSHYIRVANEDRIQLSKAYGKLLSKDG